MLYFKTLNRNNIYLLTSKSKNNKKLVKYVNENIILKLLWDPKKTF